MKSNKKSEANKECPRAVAVVDVLKHLRNNCVKERDQNNGSNKDKCDDAK